MIGREEFPPPGYFETTTVHKRYLPSDWDANPPSIDNPRFVTALREGTFGNVIGFTMNSPAKVTIYRDRVNMGGANPPDVESPYVELLQAQRQARLNAMFESIGLQRDPS